MYYKCCEHCSNNPKNNSHASGICCCTLPNMEMQRPQGVWDGFYVNVNTALESHRFERMLNPLASDWVGLRCAYGIYE
jgi:hypothetical protein